MIRLTLVMKSVLFLILINAIISVNAPAETDGSQAVYYAAIDDTSSGDIYKSSGSVSPKSVGDDSVTIIGGDGQLTDDPCPPDSPPYFIGFVEHDSVFICEGAALYDTIIAADSNDCQTITLTMLSGPGDFSSTPSSSPVYGYYSYTPESEGSFEVTFMAKDSHGDSTIVIKTYYVFISAPPVITTGDTSFLLCWVGRYFTIDVDAFDPDDDPLVFRLLSDQCDIDSITGELTFWADSPGEYCHTVEVSDGPCADTAEICATITLNLIPVFDNADQSFRFCEPDTICFTVKATDPDVDDSVVISQISGPGVFSMTTDSTGITCFLPADVDSADYVFIYEATDRCLRGELSERKSWPPAPRDTIIITVIIEEMPVLDCPDDTSIFICEPDTLCFPIGDIPEQATVTVLPPSAWYNSAEAAVCFYTNCTVQKDLKVIVESVCGMDSCEFIVDVTLNSVPQVFILPTDTSIFSCEPEEICIPVGISDVDGNIKSIIVSPQGYYNAVTGEVCFTPSASGEYTITVKAIDSCDTEGIDSITVGYELNSPPVVVSTPDSTIFFCNLGEICFPVSITDADDNISSIVVIGPGEYLNGYICFTPTEPGIFTFITEVTDECEATASDTTIIEVILNSPPVVISADDFEIIQCDIEDICFDIEVSDPDNNIQSISTSLGIYDSQNNQVCFTPEDSGTYTIIVTVSDSCYASDVDTTIVTVTTGESAHIVCPDAPIDTIICFGSIICLPLEITPADAAVSTSFGTYANGELCINADTSGTYLVEVIAVAECGSDTCEITFNVDIDEAAQLTCPPDTTIELCDAAVICRPIGVIPPDAAVTIYPIGTYEEGMICFDADTAGHYEISVKAETICGADSCLFVVDVVFNHPPEIVTGDTSFFLCESGEALTYDVDAVDPEDDAITYELLSDYGSIDANTGEISFTADTAGTYCFMVKAADFCGADDTATICATILLNSAPVVESAPDTTIIACTWDEICIAVSISDVDNNIVSIATSIGTYSDGRVCFTPTEEGVYYVITTATDICDAVGQDTTIVTIETAEPIELVCPVDTSVFICEPDTLCFEVGGIPDDASIIVWPPSAWYDADNHTICFYTNCSVKKDLKIFVVNECYDDNCMFTVDVTMNSRPLVILPPDMNIALCEWGEVCIPVGISDIDYNIVDIVVSEGAYYNPITGRICFTPSGSGEYSIVVSASDSCGAMDLDSIIININLNSPPVVTSAPDFNQLQCEPTEICFPVDISDPDDNIISITVSPYGEYDSSAGSVCFTPPDSGIYELIITATDSCDIKAEDTTIIHITLNAPPVVDAGPDTSIETCNGDQICVPVSITDPDDNIISISVTGAEYDDGYVCLTSPEPGIYEIIITATDSCDVMDDDTVIVEIIANRPPEVTAAADSSVFQCVFEEICSPVSVSDPDNNIDSVIVSPIGHYDGQLGEICFTPTDTGTYCLTITAYDACGETDADTVCITVTSGDVAQIECPIEPLSDRLCDPAEICFPLIITPATAEVSVSYGAFADNEICFYADTAGSYEITVIASEVCGSDTCTITVNIYFDEYVSITCPDLPVTASLCEPDTITILLPITPSSASLSILPFGTYNFASSKLSFFADTSGHYEITVIAESPCNVDTCVVEANVTIMDAPQVICPDDIDTLICLPEVSEICFCVEVIGIGVEVTVLPEGSYSGGMVCVPVSEAGTFMITVIASSVCGADTCEVELTIIENQTPVLTVPEDTMIAWCDDYTGHVCISGIFAVDPEDDPVTITKTCGPGTFIPARDDSGEICFEPDNIDTTYEFCFEATDGCTTDLKSFFVTMYPSPICSVCVDIAIETDSCVIVGAKVPVKLVIDTYDPIGGLDLLIGYDATAMSFLEVYKGDAIDGWEYFTYRLNDEDDCGTACPSGLLRIVGIADVNDGAHHPPSEQLTPSGILGWIMMRVANNQNLGGLYLPINFYWQDCGDNTFSNPAGDLLYIDLRIFDPFDNVIWDETDDILYPEESRPPGLGAGDSCMIGDKVTPLRCVYFHNGGVCVKHPDSIDARGDINLNGVPYEIADAVIFTNYFIHGLRAFTINVDGQIAASDVNADGFSLTIADLVYLIRVIIGDADIIPKVSPYSARLELAAHMKGSRISVFADSDCPLGAGLMIFEYDHLTPETLLLGEMAEGMEMIYSINDSEIRVLIYSFEPGKAIDVGDGKLLDIEFGGAGNISLVEASFASFHGDVVRSSIDSKLLPNEFVLSQNYPNPFNPATSIDLSLPVACHWEMTIYNINGQEVKRFSGDAEPGTVTVTWNGRNEGGWTVASGIYFYKVKAGNFTATRKMTLLK